MKVGLHHLIIMAAIIAVAYLIYRKYTKKNGEPQVNTMV